MTRAISLDLEARPYARPSLDVKIALSGNPCTVPTCGYLAGDGYVCPTCVEAWECHLENVAAMVEDLNIAEQKRVRFAPAGGSGDGAPDPVNWTAGYYLQRLNNELVGQIRMICESGHIALPKLDGPVPMSRWLLRQSLRLPKMPEQEGAGLVHDLDTMMRDCLSVIDAPTRRKYVKECECGLAVWANPEHDKARCACGREYVTDDEYEARMAIAREAWVTIREASMAADVRIDTIKKWASRGKRGKKLEVRGSDPLRVCYGDVLDFAKDAREERSA